MQSLNSAKVLRGFDFMCKGQQHHTYHIGLLANGYLDSLVLDSSCNFPSAFRKILQDNIPPIRFTGRTEQIFDFLRSIFSRKIVPVVVGIDTKWIPLIAALSIFGKRVEVQLHGQIAGIENKWKFLFWRFVSYFVKLVVANPIYGGPKFVQNIGNIGSFSYLSEKEANLECLLYGGNKRFLEDKLVQRKIIESGYSILYCLASDSGYADINDIISAASSAKFTFVALDYSHYKLSPSGRVCDLQIFELTPLVDPSDSGTQRILNEYGIEFELLKAD